MKLLINDVILNSRNKDIINFLYHPIISVEDNNEKEFIEFNHTFKEKNFDNFYKGISEIFKTISNQKKKLILLSQQKLLKLNKIKE